MSNVYISSAIGDLNGGVDEELIESGTPLRYAHGLCYLADPSTIRARVLDRFGYAPPLDEIRKMLREYQDERDQVRRNAEARGSHVSDGNDFAPRGLVPPLTWQERAERRNVRLVNGVAPTPVDPPKIPGGAPPRLASEVIACVAAAFGISPRHITGRSRLGKVIRARQTAVFVLLERGNSLMQIGRWLGGRDHSTISFAADQFRKSATPEMEMIAMRIMRETTLAPINDDDMGDREMEAGNAIERR